MATSTWPLDAAWPRLRTATLNDAFDPAFAAELAKLADAVYVLHCFQKKTQQTAKRDLDLAVQRWKQIQAQG